MPASGAAFSVVNMPKRSSHPEGCRAEVPAGWDVGSSVGFRAISKRTQSSMCLGGTVFGPAGRAAVTGPSCADTCVWKTSGTWIR